MDIQKEREAFEKLPEIKKRLDMKCVHFNGTWYATNPHMGNSFATASYLNGAWMMAWQAAKAQAVPEGYVLVKVSGRDQEMLELIDQRDHMESQAEELKDKLQALYGVDFGEHSSCNFPFQNAIDYDDSDLVLVPKEPTEETLTNMTNAPIVVNHLCDNADIFLSEDEARIAYKAAIKAQEPTND